jgi:hypothetical protein
MDYKMLQLRDWQAIKQQIALELVGTKEGLEAFAESKRYGLAADRIERLESGAVPEWLERETFAVQYNPNCPSRYLVRLIGSGFGSLDMKHHLDGTRDAVGYGSTLSKAAENARLRRGDPSAIGNVLSSSTSRLALAMSAKTDAVLREAVTRFLGRDDWRLDDLRDRGVMQHLPSGVEVFCLDGVALVELLPITVEHECKGGSEVINATRRHRFLVPKKNAMLDKSIQPEAST